MGIMLENMCHPYILSITVLSDYVESTTVEHGDQEADEPGGDGSVDGRNE